MEKPQRYLFVCMGNINRSIVGAEVFRELLSERKFKVGSLEEKTGSDFYVGSAGVMVDDWESDGRQYTDELGDSVDKIFAADWQVARILASDYDTVFSKIVDLGIGDFYKIRVNALDRFALRTVMQERLKNYVPEN
jgi:protein-tyrosine-phosphatase